MQRRIDEHCRRRTSDGCPTACRHPCGRAWIRSSCRGFSRGAGAPPHVTRLRLSRQACHRRAPRPARIGPITDDQARLRSTSHTPLMRQYLAAKAEYPGHAGVLPHGRFLRAVLRRRAQGGAPARHHADPARAVGRRADSDGRRAVSRGRRLSRQAGPARRIGRDLRADRRSGRWRRASSSARSCASSRRARSPTKRCSRSAATTCCWRSRPARSDALRPGLGRSRPAAASCSAKSPTPKRWRPSSRGCSRPRRWSARTSPGRSSSAALPGLRKRAAVAFRRATRARASSRASSARATSRGFGVRRHAARDRRGRLPARLRRGNAEIRAAAPRRPGGRERRATRSRSTPRRGATSSSTRTRAAAPSTRCSACSIARSRRWARACCAAGCIGRCAIAHVAAPARIRRSAR